MTPFRWLAAPFREDFDHVRRGTVDRRPHIPNAPARMAAARERAMMRSLVVSRPAPHVRAMQQLGADIEQEQTRDALRRAGMVV